MTTYIAYRNFAKTHALAVLNDRVTSRPEIHCDILALVNPYLSGIDHQQTVLYTSDMHGSRDMAHDDQATSDILDG